MPRLLVHVEGESEETFVNTILSPHLQRFGFTDVSARLMGNSRQRDKRGGVKAWSAVRGDIIKHLKGDSGCAATMMVDYYGLPKSGGREWPGRQVAPNSSMADRPLEVEKAMLNDIAREMGAGFDPMRFVPFVMMHEFEALLFSDCANFAHAIARPDLATSFQCIRDEFLTPEAINDSPETAPSKRIAKLMPNYQKPLMGTLALLAIPLDTVRRECPHFGEWLGRLEAIQRRRPVP